MDADADSVTITFPSEYTKGSPTVGITTLADGCKKATVTSVTNPAALTTTGLFGLRTTTTCGQLTNVNKAFGTVATGPTVKAFSSTEVRFYEAVVGTEVDTTTAKTKLGETGTLEFRLKLSDSLRARDIFTLTFPSNFNLANVNGESDCRSVFLGLDSVEDLDALWLTNKVKGTSAMKTTGNTTLQEYQIDCEV